jgi:hypothetical protein
MRNTDRWPPSARRPGRRCTWPCRSIPARWNRGGTWRCWIVVRIVCARPSPRRRRVVCTVLRMPSCCCCMGICSAEAATPSTRDVLAACVGDDCRRSSADHGTRASHLSVARVGPSPRSRSPPPRPGRRIAPSMPHLRCPSHRQRPAARRPCTLKIGKAIANRLV